MLASMDSWQRYVVAVGAFLAAVVQLWSIIEKNWPLMLVTLVLAVIAAALYVVSYKYFKQHPLPAQALQIVAIGFLVAIPLLALTVLYLNSIYPRQAEAGATTIAVAEFEGPPLPDPYKECRPSDMLVHTLAGVGRRLGGLRAYELPYSVNPDNRRAESWAVLHGLFDAADVIVYGEYILYTSEKGGTSQTADEIVINPDVSNVPYIPIGYTSAPLSRWDFPGSVARIQDLCGSDLREAAHPARFLDDARRGAAAIVGLRALGNGNLETALDAQGEAQRVEVAQPQPCQGDPNGGSSRNSNCSGVLAFYLATLDARLGSLQRAVREYQYAAGRLGTPEPYIDLGELDMRLGKSSAAFEAFTAAVNADPNSVAALATRAQYERDWLRPREAAIDLGRAADLEWQIDSQKVTRPPGDIYNRIALSRALFQRGGDGGAACGIARLGNVLYPNIVDVKADSDPVPDSRVGPEVLVEYAIWLNEEKRAGATSQLKAALKTHPEHVHANYELGMMLERAKPPDKVAAAYYLRRAEYASALTDDDYLYQANAASELATHFDTDPIERNHDRNRASDDYDNSLKVNHGAVYAYYGRAKLETQRSPQAALNDFEMAAMLHPYDSLLQSSLGQFFEAHGRLNEANQYLDKARYVLRARIPKDEYGWSREACRYASPPPVGSPPSIGDD